MKKNTQIFKLVPIICLFYFFSVHNGNAQDNDGDLIPDITDVDDDNDGISDNMEGECIATSILDWSVYWGFLTSPTMTPPSNVTVDGVVFTPSLSAPSIPSSGDVQTQRNGTQGTEISGLISEMVGNTITYQVSFSRPVKDLSFSVVDIDSDLPGPFVYGDYVDRVQVIATNNGTPIPLVQGVHYTVGSDVAVVGAAEFEGTSLDPIDTGSSADVSFSIPELTDQITILYTNASSAPVPLLQFILLSDMNWCLATDTDMDNVPDYLDLDADNDGIYDIVEAGNISLDSDNDGDIDTNDIGFADINGDGQDDTAATITPTDTGSTGIFDFINLDSDSDGCNDANEAYNDPNADGGDSGVYGVDPVDPTTIINANGTVIAATYLIPFDDGDLIRDFQQVGPDFDLDGVSNACDTTNFVVNLTASAATAVEGGSDGEFTATLNMLNTTGSDIVVPLVMSGVAIDGTDYTSIVEIIIPNGASSGVVLVDALADGLIEGDETVIASLGSLPSGVFSGTNTSATVTITDRTIYTVDLTASTAMALEGGVDGVFTATLDMINTTGSDIVIPLVMSGVAIDGTDYTSIVEIIIANGVSSGVVLVDALADGLIEGDETVIASLGSLPSGVFSGTNTSATVTITDRTIYTVDLTASTAMALEGGVDGVFTATLDMINTTGSDIVIPLVMSGVAIDGTDYTSIVEIIIANGVSSGVVLVDALADGLIEGDETVIASLGSLPSGVFSGTNTSATVTITDRTIYTVDLTASTAMALEGGVDGVFTATLDMINTTGSDIVIPLVMSGVAIDGTDYTSIVEIIIANGVSSGVVLVDALADGLIEGDETVIASLGSLPFGVFSGINTSATVTITDPVLSGNLNLLKTGEFVDINNNGIPNVGDEIHYTFTIENIGNIVVSNIVLVDELVGIMISGDPINLNPGESNTNNFSAIYVLTEDDILIGSVVNQAMVTGKDAFGMDVIDFSDDPLDDTNLDIDSDGDFEDITITILPQSDIRVYEGISPNGDGANDVLRIAGLQNYPDNNLQIFNRWGIKVFEEQGYEQPGKKLFDGVSRGRATVKKEEQLPVGTYFYMLQYRNMQGFVTSKTGYIYVNR